MDIVIRATAAYVFIIFMLRIIGRRELSLLGPADLVLLVVMGDLIQSGVTQSDYSVTGVFLAVSTFALLTAAMSFVTYKWRRAQTLIEGEPLILVEDGRPIEKNLRAERLNLDDVAEEARGQGIESVDEIKWCVLETSGTMSFIKKKG
ncbi:MAG TPA: YetF domain-containing protein [Gaiellaceae bacterium]|nr:YetF domain-containing protein [Gaiellaceae bacterium]